jgi:hypothetical protein
MRASSSVASVVFMLLSMLLLGFIISCGGATIRLPARAPSDAQMAELWIDPGAQPRDLFYGVGGKQYAPAPDVRYAFEEKDETGFSASYDVTGPDGVKWSAKIGPEAQTEVVVSRILWGLGYHQPPVYYLPKWNLATADGKVRIESEARFRPKLPQLKRLDEYWTWAESPLLGTRPLNGLLVVLLMLNGTDLKDDNNSIYELSKPWDGARRWQAVRDVGAALGETGKLFPRRNYLEGFEQEGFIEGVEQGRVKFAYRGRHQRLLDVITPADVRWAAGRMRGLTDAQWRAAFRGANYSDAVADRYIRRIKQKIADGLALRDPASQQ